MNKMLSIRGGTQCSFRTLAKVARMNALPKDFPLPQGINDLKDCIFDYFGCKTNSNQSYGHLILYIARENIPSRRDVLLCYLVEYITLTPPLKHNAFANQFE